MFFKNKEKLIEFLFKEKYFLKFLGILLFLNIFAHLPELTNRYCVFPDSKIGYILHHLRDLSLFRDDIFVCYLNNTLSKLYAVFDIYSLVVLFKSIPLTVFLAILSLIQGVATGIIVFLISRKIFGDKFSFFLSVIFMVYALTTNSFFGGQARGLGYLLTAAFFFSLIGRQYNRLFAIIIISLLLYNMIVPAMCVSTFVLLIVDSKLKKMEKLNNFKWLFLVVTLSAVAALGVINFYPESIPDFSKSMQYKYLYGPPLGSLFGGNYKYGGIGYSTGELFGIREGIFNLVFNFNCHLSVMHSILSILFLYIGLIIYIAFKEYQKVFGKEPWIFLFSNFFVFIIVAWCISLPVASRVLKSSLPIFLVFFFCQSLYYVLNRFKLQRLVYPILLLFIVNLLIFCPHHNLRDYSRFKLLYEYISTLPKDSLIAGNPATVDSIPFFAKRQVFYMADYAQIPANKQFHEAIANRKHALVQALYSNSRKEISEFIRENNITHFILDKQYFQTDFLDAQGISTTDGDYFWEIQQIIKESNPQRQFPILDIVSQQARFKMGSVMVADAQDILNVVENKTEEEL